MSDPKPMDPDLQKALESLERTIEANPPKAEPEPQKPPPAKVIQLPLWPEARRAAPNAVFRSALFPALHLGEERQFLDNERIASVRGIDVFFTGKRFDQSDLDVYLELLDLARAHPLGAECTFSAHGMLKRLHRTTGLSAYQWLHKVLIRLSGGVVDITDHKKRYFGTLIEGGLKDEITKHYRITINPKFLALFGFGLWSSIDREQRYAIGHRKAIAKALHAYYSTHAAPGAHGFDTLATIVGLQDKAKRRQRARLIEAHKLLVKVGFLRGYMVSEDGRAITTDPKPTSGQARHLVKKAIECRRTFKNPRK
ncbi:MAG: TrfA family protein [Deltaproteobacteria bacterium]|nr:TrfA family protein [Deltaproteobacteria bacterium]